MASLKIICTSLTLSMMVLGCDSKLNDDQISSDVFSRTSNIENAQNSGGIASDVFFSSPEMVVKESGGTFMEQAKSILLISSLLEDPSSFYSEIKRCKELKEKSEHCKKFIKVTSQSVNTFLADRSKKNLHDFVVETKNLSEVD